MTEEKKPAEATAQPAPANEAPVELTVQDLGNIKQIIDVASQRGAFKPNEMTTVGTTYTKLETFLAAVAQQQQATNSATEGEK
jgi:hypothetical protein